jgi:sulfite oxidase
MKHPDFVTVQAAPFNGAPAPALLAAAPQTPAEAFFVRNHGDVPQLAGDDHVIRVGGLVARPLTISVRELRALPQRAVEAVIACAGNRRSELAAIAPVPGELPWQHTALGNAQWGGVPLSALLAMVQPLPEAQHVCFEGADVATAGGGKGHRFGASVPLAHADRALLALSMQGQPLPPAHGAPLRMVVPGYIGARSVKWLTDITLSATPSDNHYQHGTYRKYPRELTSAPADVTQGEMLGPLSVNSAFLAPLDGAHLPAGECTLRGLGACGLRRAAGAGRGVDRWWRDVGRGALHAWRR